VFTAAFADDHELKQSLRNAFRRRRKEFYDTGIQRLTQSWQKFAENDGDFVEE
jgi:hypothetical protein